MKGLALEICEKPGRNRVFTKKIKGFHTEKQILLEVKRPDYFWYRITGFPGVIGPMRNPFVTAFMALWPWGLIPTTLKVLDPNCSERQIPNPPQWVPDLFPQTKSMRMEPSTRSINLPIFA